MVNCESHEVMIETSDIVGAYPRASLDWCDSGATDYMMESGMSLYTIPPQESIYKYIKWQHAVRKKMGIRKGQP